MVTVASVYLDSEQDEQQVVVHSPWVSGRAPRGFVEAGGIQAGGSPREHVMWKGGEAPLPVGHGCTSLFPSLTTRRYIT